MRSSSKSNCVHYRRVYTVAANCLALTLVFSLVFAMSLAVEAQVARVAAVQRIIETKTGEAGTWRKSHTGATLRVNDRLRTGKRSKVDLKFTDGSLLRLGQLSSVEIRGPKNVALTTGQVLFSAIRPGTRIVAGAATAEIKGSSGVVTVFEDNSSEYILFAGALDIFTTETGPRFALPPGFQVGVTPQGEILRPRVAPPFAFSSNAVRPDISTPPQTGPFVGSDIDILVRAEPDRLLNEPTAETLLVSDPVLGQGNPYIPPRGGNNTGAPFPIPFPTLGPPGGFGPPGGVAGALVANGVRRRDQIGQRDGARPSRALTPMSSLGAHRSTLAPSIVPFLSLPLAEKDDTPAITPAALQLPATAPSDAIPPETLQAGDTAEDTAALQSLDLTEAGRHLNGAYDGSGQLSGGDINVVGALGDSGLRAYGGRLHAYSARGPWHVDLAAQSIRVRAGNAAIRDLDLTAVSSATLTYRDQRGDILLGRQRFQEGPVQATLFGSLVRQGTREIMDAARIRPNVGKNNRLELAYLFDAFPRNLPYRIRGRQRGLYGRFATQGHMGRVGVNVLKYNNLPIPSSTGATLDFAIPVIRNKVELYGEVGRDTFRRRLTTAGLSFPGLYDRTDFDVYLEYANLRSSGIALRPPTELTLRVYRRINDNANIIASASRFYGSGSSVIIGVSFGGGESSHYGLR